MIRLDYYDDEGCCLTCLEDNKEGETLDGKCICSDCKCGRCIYHVEVGEYCEKAKEHQRLRRLKWFRIKERFKKKNRFWRFCPSCNKKRFMLKFPEWDEFIRWKCPSCKYGFIKEDEVDLIEEKISKKDFLDKREKNKLSEIFV